MVAKKQAPQQMSFLAPTLKEQLHSKDSRCLLPEAIAGDYFATYSEAVSTPSNQVIMRCSVVTKRLYMVTEHLYMMANHSPNGV